MKIPCSRCNRWYPEETMTPFKRQFGLNNEPLGWADYCCPACTEKRRRKAAAFERTVAAQEAAIDVLLSLPEQHDIPPIAVGLAIDAALRKN